MFISKKTLRIVAAQLGVALALFSYSDALAQGVTISQTPGTNFVAFEAEDAFAFVNADDETGWNIVDTDDPFVTAKGSEVLAADTSASRAAAIWDFNGGSVDDFTHWKVQFVEPGDYSLYISYSMFDINGTDGYGNEDSIYVSSEFGTTGVLVGSPADPTGDRDSKPSYYGNLPTGGEWEGNFSWWNAEPDGSDNSTVNVDGIYTPQLNTILDFGIASRERGVAIDKIVFHTDDDLSPEALDALPTFAPNTGNPGDFDDNGEVNLADFLIMSANFNRAFPLAESFEKGDQTRDGVVDLADFLAVRKIFNAPPAAAASIPEPGAMSLGMCAAVGLAALRRRRRSGHRPCS